jgi:hypothetical protein
LGIRVEYRYEEPYGDGVMTLIDGDFCLCGCSAGAVYVGGGKCDGYGLGESLDSGLIVHTGAGIRL